MKKAIGSLLFLGLFIVTKIATHTHATPEKAPEASEVSEASVPEISAQDTQVLLYYKNLPPSGRREIDDAVRKLERETGQ